MGAGQPCAPPCAPGLPPVQVELWDTAGQEGFESLRRPSTHSQPPGDSYAMLCRAVPMRAARPPRLTLVQEAGVPWDTCYHRGVRCWELNIAEQY